MRQGERGRQEVYVWSFAFHLLQLCIFVTGSKEYCTHLHNCAGVDTDELLQEAIDTCPVNCIHWVRSLIICFAKA